MLKLPTHHRYDYSSIEKRRDFNWPDGKRLAFYVALNVEQFAFMTGRGADPTQRGGPQTQRNFAWRDYGLRVGIWRIFRLLDELRLPATILLNSLVCENFPTSSSGSGVAATMCARTGGPMRKPSARSGSTTRPRSSPR